MPGPSPSLLLASVAFVVAGLLACSASAPPVLSCSVPEECPAGARCVSSACVQNAPPSPSVAVPPSPRTNVLLSFDASASADPDPGDSVVSFAWGFRQLSGAPCELPTVADTGPLANVRFGCPGRYAVDVTAKDELEATSTATAELDVAAYAGAALVTVGADLAIDHVCTPTPRCTPAGPVALSASTPGIPPDQVAFAWTVEPPPERPLAPSRRVAFSPSAAAQAPAVAIETDGEAISGDWIFRVEARDAAGVIGVAAMRVSIGNRPPVVTETIPVPVHAFNGTHFTSAGEVPVAVADPDGDALLDRTVEWRHSGDGASTFTGGDDASRVTFAIAVPYLAPEDAYLLIGGEGLARTIVFGISDVNGARTVESWDIIVGNRPPFLVNEPAPFTIDHSYDPVALAYVADVPLSKWADLDGDPLHQVPGSGTGDPDCAELVVASAARARCRLPFAGTPAVGNFAGTHTVTQAIQDPWAPAAATSTVTFTIANRPPSIGSTATHVIADRCTFSSVCCQGPENECVKFSATAAAGEANVPGRWEDPDGDPLAVQVTGAGSVTPVQPLVCAPASCALQLGLAELEVCGTTTNTLATTITDGLATASGGLPVERGCP